MIPALLLSMALTSGPVDRLDQQVFIPPKLPAVPIAGLRVPAHGAPLSHHPNMGRVPVDHGGHGHAHGGGFILPPAPGIGRGFPNGAPEGYGWYDTSGRHHLGGDRTTAYYFPRHYAAPTSVLFLPTYFNPFVTRGQRYIPYVGCGDFLHPAGGPPTGPANLPVTPYRDLYDQSPVEDLPEFSGEVEAEPVDPSETEQLIP